MRMPKTAVDRGVTGKRESDSHGTPMNAPHRGFEKFHQTNEMYDCGYAKAINARQRAFGVLGFDDSPEAQIGGTLLHKVSEEEEERGNG